VPDSVLLPDRALDLKTGRIGAVPKGTRPTTSLVVFRRVPSGARTVHDGDTVGESGTQDGSATPTTVDTGVWLCTHELSQKQWQSMATLGSMAALAQPWTEVDPASAGGSSAVGDNLPAWGMDALSAESVLQGYAAYRGGITLRLPTSAEWESAARAPAGAGRFGWGDTASVDTARRYAVVRETTTDNHPSAIAGRAALGGWYDMHGNVWEWAMDLGVYHLRGGSWCDALASADSGNRRELPSETPYALAGVRPVLVLP
jgi:formylglycine-generating enzyme required for sulfatase activity